MTVAAIGTALAVGSAVVGGIQGYTSSQYRAQVARMNAKIAEQNAERAIQRTGVEAQDEDATTLAMLGELEAQQGASGLTLNSRTFRNVRKNAREVGRLNTQRIVQGGQIEAYNYRTDAANFTAEARAARSDAMFSLLKMPFDIGTSLIGRAGKVRSPERYTSGYTPTARLPRPRPRSLLR